MSYPVGPTRNTSHHNSVTETPALPQRPPISEGISNAPSNMSSAGEPASSSCFSQIWAAISSLLFSISSWISSLFYCVTEEAEVAAPVRTSAEIANTLIGKAHRFFNETVIPNIPREYPRKIACFVSIGDQRIGACVQDLQSNSRQEAADPIQAFARAVIVGLDTILSTRASLNENTELHLELADFHCIPAVKDQQELSGMWRISWLKSSADSYASFIDLAFQQRTVGQVIQNTGALSETLVNFFNNSNNTAILASWAYETPSV